MAAHRFWWATWVASLALVLAGIAPSRAHADFWSVSRADTAGDVGESCSLALDAQGNPRVAYYDFDRQDLKYAERINGLWTTVTLDTAGNVGRFTSIAVDAQGEPQIVYQDVTQQDLKYAYRSGGTWTIETIDATGLVGAYASLALDYWGAPHVAYYDQTNGDLRYARKQSGYWFLETIDNANNVGTYASIAVDGSGYPHCAYRDNTNGDLKYANRAFGYWNANTVDATNNTGFFASIGLQSDGTIHLAYYDASLGRLKYAGGVPGSWTLEPIDVTVVSGFYASLKVDAAGRPHVAYRQQISPPNGDVKYALRDNGSWTITAVDTLGDVGYYTTLALDASDQPRICYYNNTDFDLMFTELISGGNACQPNYVWHPGPSIKLTKPLSYWPPADTLLDMAPNDAIAFSVLAQDLDWLVTTCVDCDNKPRTIKWGPHADQLEYVWVLAADPDGGTLLQAGPTHANSVLYQIPKCWPDGEVTRTDILTLTIRNRILGFKATDLQISYVVEIEMKNPCQQPGPHGIEVRLNVLGGVVHPDLNPSEGGSGKCIPQEPAWVVDDPIQILPDTILAVYPPDLCPDYILLLTTDPYDQDKVHMQCLDQQEPTCTPQIGEAETDDPMKVTWGLVSGAGSFPLGNEGTTVAFRRSRSQDAVVSCTIADSHTQFFDLGSSAMGNLTKALKPRALVAVGDRSDTYWGIPVNAGDVEQAGALAVTKYEAAGYLVVHKTDAVIDDVVDAMKSSCYQAIWMSGHGSAGTIRMTDGGFGYANINSAILTGVGCLLPNVHPYVRELIALGCKSHSSLWHERTACPRIVDFTYDLEYDLFPFVHLHGLLNPYNWEDKMHTPVPPHNLAGP